MVDLMLPDPTPSRCTCSLRWRTIFEDFILLCSHVVYVFFISVSVHVSHVTHPVGHQGAACEYYHASTSMVVAS